MKLLIILMFVLSFPMLGLAQLSDVNMNKNKELSYKEYLQIKLDILSSKLSSGSYQTEKGRLDFPVDIYLDDSCFIKIDIYLDCSKQEVERDIEIVKDQYHVVVAGILEVVQNALPQYQVDRKELVNNILKSYLYINADTLPIGKWIGDNFVRINE